MTDIAFLVLAHRSPDGLARLVERLQPHQVFVHVDAKSDQAAFRVVTNRIGVVPVEPMSVNWAGFSMVAATMRLVEAALLYSRASHFVLLTGACYPVRPMAELERLLATEQRQFINYHRITASTPHWQPLISRRWYQDPIPALPPWADAGIRAVARKAGKVPALRRPLPTRFQPVFGSQLWALTRECLEYVARVYHQDHELRRFYARCWAPDEHYVHTVIANSPFADERHLVPYFGHVTARQSPLHLIHPSWDATFRSAEEFDLVARSGKYFIRKVWPEQSALLDRIDAELLGVAV